MMRVPRQLSVVPLGLCCLLLASCGSSGKGLIPSRNAGPLQGDFEAIARAAESGNGSCTATATAIRKTEQDLAALPPTIDAGLHKTIETGMSNLRSRALTLCAQSIPPPEATTTLSSTTTSKSTQSSTTSSSTTQTTETTSTQSTPTESATATTPSGPGGGTQAPGSDNPGGGAATPGTGNAQQTPGSGAAPSESGAGGPGQ
jgi:hypothetical protein